MSFILSVLAGFLSGIISGFGIGGGTVLMVYLTAVLSLPQRTAQGINLLYFLPTAAAALLIHRKNSYLEKKAILPAALAGCISAAVFSFIAMYLDTDLLKKLFGGFLIITGISEILKKPNAQGKNRR